MKAIRVKVEDLRIIQEFLRAYGYSISNPDQVKGDYLDIIIRNGQRIAGFDLLLDGDEYSVYNFEKDGVQALKWVERNGKTRS